MANIENKDVINRPFATQDQITADKAIALDYTNLDSIDSQLDDDEHPAA